MLIQEVELLKIWLVEKLEPICDADPAALAKYVIALAKKDKSEEDLRALCEDQLDVFLGEETKPFVAELFAVLHSKTYITPVGPKIDPVKEDEVAVLPVVGFQNENGENKGQKRKSIEEQDKLEAEKVQKIASMQDVSSVAHVEDSKNVRRSRRISQRSSLVESAENTDFKPENDSHLVNASYKSSLRTSDQVSGQKERIWTKSSSRQKLRTEVEEILREDDAASMRSLSQDRSIRSVSPSMKARHPRHRSSRSPRSSRSRTSRRDRSRREHDRSRDRHSHRRKPREKCRDYEEKGYCFLGEDCQYDHGSDAVEVDDRNLPSMLNLASFQSPIQQQPSSIQTQMSLRPQLQQVFPAGVHHLRPIHMLPGQMPIGAVPISLNSALTTVQMQPRPIPSPVELPPNQVPIFRPRNPAAFIRNLSPPGAMMPVLRSLLPSQQLQISNGQLQPIILGGGIAAPVSIPVAAPMHGSLPTVATTSNHHEIVPVSLGVSSGGLSTTVSSVKISASSVGEIINSEPYNPEQPSIENDEVLTGPLPSKGHGPVSLASNGVMLSGNASDIRGDRIPIVSSVPRSSSNEENINELMQIAMGNISGPGQPLIQGQSLPHLDVSQGTLPGHLGQPLPFPTQLGFPSHPGLQFQILQQNPFIQPSFVPDLLQQTYMPMPVSSGSAQQQFQFAHQEQQQQFGSVPAPNNIQIQRVRPYHNQTVLELRKVPVLINTVPKLSEFFQKFGTVTKIQTPLDSDPSGALVEFTTHREAQAAYNSPEAILGNRFIKMFWHNPNKSQPIKGSPQVGAVNAGGAGDPANVNSNSADVKPKPKLPSFEELSFKNPKADPKLVHAEKKKELTNRTIEFMKKKQEHLEEMMKKQKDVLEKLASGGKSFGKPEKSKHLTLLKALDGTITKLQKEIADCASEVAIKSSLSRDPKKEFLDSEMDIYHENLSGPELLEARKKLEQLRREAGFEKSVSHVNYRGMPRGRGRGRGRGAWRGRGGYNPFGNAASLDNRPKSILITNFDADDKDELISLFMPYGDIDRIEEKDSGKLILTFHTRQQAEIAATQGAVFKGKQLSLSWYSGPARNELESSESSSLKDDLVKLDSIARRTRSSSSSLIPDKEDDDMLDIDKEEEDMLLAGADDDEEEESDDRPWRR